MDGPLSAPLEQKHARGATAPDKWRPERGYCRRPPATPPRKTLRSVPLYAKRPCEPPPTPSGPGPWLNRGENEIERRIFRGARPSTLDKLSIGSVEQHDSAGRFHGNDPGSWNAIAGFFFPRARKVFARIFSLIKK